MLYSFLHITLRFWLKIHFKRIFFSGHTNIPRKGAVVLACNHPNSFLDAIAIALLIRRPIHFLVRSDVFRKPAARWILTKLNMIPIYRLQEGTENLEKNHQTFKYCYEILKQGKVLLIFSEGNCVLEKRLRPMKKGTARIVLGTLHETGWDFPVTVVPVGLNYTYATKFRSELIVSAGKGFTAHDLKDAWNNEPARAIRMFNQRLHPSLESQLIIIPDKELDKATEVALAGQRSLTRYPFWKRRFFDNARLKREQQIASFVAKCDKAFIERLERFGKATHAAGIHPEKIEPAVQANSTGILLAGFIPAVFSAILHWLPASLAQRITRKTVRDPKFRSSVLFGTGAILTLLWYLILAIVLLIVCPEWTPVIFTLPVFLFFSLAWWELLQQRKNRLRIEFFKRKHPQQYHRWEIEKEDLLSSIP